MNARVANNKAHNRILTCAKYNKYGVNHCSQHRLEYNALYQIVLKQIRTYAALALQDEESVMAELKLNCHTEDESEKEQILSRISGDKKRLEKLERMVDRLYEDRIAGRINDANFDRMIQKVQTEQDTLQKKVDLANARLEEESRVQEDNSKWLALIRKYADITELDREMLHLLISQIVVHEDIIDGKRDITAEIHFNFMAQPGSIAVENQIKAAN